MILTTYRLLY